MKLFKFLSLMLTAMLLVGCGGPQYNNTYEIDAPDPNATRVFAPGVSEDDVSDNSLTDDTDSSTESGYVESSSAESGSSQKTTPQQPSDGSVRIKFLAAGDNIIHENVFIDAKNRARDGEDYNFYDMYVDIKDFVNSADLKFVNQETPLGGAELGYSGYPNFNGPQEAGEALVDIGFNIVNIATNHMLDKKEAGLIGSIDFWNSQPVTLLGGYYNKDDYENIRVVEQDGVKIAFLSYTYGLNGMTLSASSDLYIPLIDEAEIVRMVDKAETLADMVFVVMHWGDENSFKASSEQKQLASAISAVGADAIIGMHSHTVQPMEWIDNADGSRTLVIYSLGNLISTMLDNFNMVGGIVTFDIVKKDGVCTIENPIFNPTVTHYDADRLNLQVYMLEDYTEELAASHGTAIWGSDKRFSLDIAKGYVTSTIASEFLPDYLK